MGGGASKSKYRDGGTESEVNLQSRLGAVGKYENVTIGGGDVVKQKVSVHHVVNEVFYCAPVRVRSETYPKQSDRAGEQYIWIELDERAIDENERLRLSSETGNQLSPEAATDSEKHKQNFPSGVCVDNIGNITILARGNGKPQKISGEDVMASFTVPVAPNAPTFLSKHAEEVNLEWSGVLGLINMFELRYRVANEIEDKIPWDCFHCLVEMESNEQFCSSCGAVKPLYSQQCPLDPRFKTSKVWESLGQVSIDSPSYTLTGIQCGIPYVFSVRARNRVGWGEYSPKSIVLKTLPEPPSKPNAPSFQKGALRHDRILLQWSTPKVNGRPISVFELHGGAVKDEQIGMVFHGPKNFSLLSNLKPEQSYHYKVCAVNEIGTSPFSEYITFRTPPIPRPKDGVESESDSANESPKAHPPCDWIEVFDETNASPCYLNVVTGSIAFDRPAVMDGPVDPIVEFKKKRFKFNRVLLKGMPKGAHQVVRLNIRRESFLWDSFEQVMQISLVDLRKKVKVDYVGEEGIDAGGIGKDWFLEVSRLLCQSKTNLFVKNEDGNMIDIKINSSGPEQPDSGGGNLLDAVNAWYYFVGRFLGKAIVDRQLVDIHFSTTLFKQIFGFHVDIDDLRISDPTLVKSMEWILENPIDGILFEEFCVHVDPPPGSTLKEKVVIDLVPGGRNIEVDDSNKEEYVEKMLEWRAVTSCQDQIQAIRNGFFEVVPEDLLKSVHFELPELEMLWNGLPIIDVLAIRSSCIYQGGFDENHNVVHWFWKIFKEMEHDEKALLLRFATGTSKVPVDGLDPPLNLTLNDALDPNALCKAHSCFNQLVFPDYTSHETMREKILYAIKNTDGFLLG